MHLIQYFLMRMFLSFFLMTRNPYLNMCKKNQVFYVKFGSSIFGILLVM